MSPRLLIALACVVALFVLATASSGKQKKKPTGGHKGVGGHAGGGHAGGGHSGGGHSGGSHGGGDHSYDFTIEIGGNGGHTTEESYSTEENYSTEDDQTNND